MAPLTPAWAQPSHAHIMQVVHTSSDPNEYQSYSISNVSLPAGAVFAELTTPPLTLATKAYSTVQTSATTHVELNSDLVYINHSCAPSLEFDIEKMEIRVARDREGGLKEGDELTFFYPSTEWEMAQPFQCRCGAATCKGWIAGASQMSQEVLKGYWLNHWLEEALQEKWRMEKADGANGAPTEANGALNGNNFEANHAAQNGKISLPAGAQRQGASARELAGEMGGDTTCKGTGVGEGSGVVGGEEDGEGVVGKAGRKSCSVM
jgi:hypothetical protein